PKRRVERIHDVLDGPHGDRWRPAVSDPRRPGRIERGAPWRPRATHADRHPAANSENEARHEGLRGHPDARDQGGHGADDRVDSGPTTVETDICTGRLARANAQAAAINN